MAKQYAKKKTLSICKFHLRGTCKNEEHCQYLHYRLPCHYGDSCTRKSCPYTHKLQDTSTVQCHFYAEGRCRNGDHCNFAHSGGDDHDDNGDNDEELEAFCNEVYAVKLNVLKMANCSNFDEEFVDGPDGDYTVRYNAAITAV